MTAKDIDVRDARQRQGPSVHQCCALAASFAARAVFSLARPLPSPERPAPSPRRGYSLVFVMIVLMSFIAVFPLMFQQLETGHRRTTTVYAWSKIQAAAESGLQRAMYEAAQEREIATMLPMLSYPLSSGTLRVHVGFKTWRDGGGDYSLLASAVCKVLESGVEIPAGFDDFHVMASFSAVGVLSRWFAYSTPSN